MHARPSVFLHFIKGSVMGKDKPGYARLGNAESTGADGKTAVMLGMIATELRECPPVATPLPLIVTIIDLFPLCEDRATVSGRVQSYKIFRRFTTQVHTRTYVRTL